MNGERTRRELTALLAAYLAGDAGLGEFMGWEAELSLDPAVAGQLRRALDRLALAAEEVADGSRGEREFRALAAETMRGGPAAAPGAAAETGTVRR